MGQKVHPYGFRVGTLYGWQSNWFAGKNYAEQLHEDVQIRRWLRWERGYLDKLRSSLSNFGRTIQVRIQPKKEI